MTRGTILPRWSDVLAGPVFAPPLQKGAPRSGRGSGFLRSLRLAVLGSSFYPKGDFAGGRARRGQRQNSGPPPQGRPARPPVPALSRLIRSGVRTGAPSSPGAGFWRTELFLIAYVFWNRRPSLRFSGYKKAAPDIRACRLGIRQPQKGSFHGMLRCPCSEYIPSIPAPVASPDAKISLFAVRSSFAGAISFRQNRKHREYLCVFPVLSMQYGRKRATQNLSSPPFARPFVRGCWHVGFEIRRGRCGNRRQRRRRAAPAWRRPAGCRNPGRAQTSGWPPRCSW